MNGIRQHIYVSFRRAAGIAAASLGIAFGAARAQQAPQTDSVKSMLTETQRKTANDSLAARSTKDVLKTLQYAKNNYSKSLAELDTLYTRRLHELSGDTTGRVLFFDQNTYAMANALGLSSGGAVMAMMQEKGINISYGMASEISMLMDNTYLAPVIQNFLPQAQPTTIDIPGFPCMIAALSPSGISPPSSSLTPAEEFALINGHEGWHCLSKDHYMINDSMTHAQIISTQSKRETTADLGVIGDAIRNGSSTEIIDHLMEERRDDVRLLHHYTVPGLIEFKKRLTAMGIDQFKSLTIVQLAALYYDITDAIGIKPEVVDALKEYTYADSTQREKLIAAADPHMIRAIHLHQLAQNANASGFSVAPEDSARIINAFQGSNALKTIGNTAFAKYDEVTPETMLKAYAFLQDSLRQRRIEEPRTLLYSLQMDMLRAVLQHNMDELDYITANERRGVDLLKSATLGPIVKAVLAAPPAAKPPQL